MNIMTRWNGNDGLLPATLGGLNELFRSVFDQVADFGPEWMSDRIGGRMLDVEVGEKEVKVTLPLPGCRGDEIEVEMLGDVLTVRAERSEERGDGGEEKHYLRRERSTMSRRVREAPGEGAGAEGERDLRRRCADRGASAGRGGRRQGSCGQGSVSRR